MRRKSKEQGKNTKKEDGSNIAIADKLKQKSRYRFACSAKEDHNQSIYSVAFCDCEPEYDSFFATVGGNRATVYECLEDGALNVVQCYIDGNEQESFYTAGWSVDVLTGDPLLAIAGFCGNIKLINCITQSVIMILSGHGNCVNEIRFHPIDRNLLISSSKDESVRLWNCATGICIAIFAGHGGHRDEVLSADIHLLGNCIASCGMDNSIKLWNMEDDKVISSIKALYTNPKPSDGKPFATEFVQFPSFSTTEVHSDYVDCVRWVGDLLVSKSTGNKSILWKPNTSRAKDAVTILREYQFHDADLWFIKFDLDRDREILALGNTSGTVCLWEIDSNCKSPIARLDTPMCKSPVRQVAFSSNGRHLVLCCDDSTIWHWEMVS